jgi:NDP-sugar pyrophosphorylase family protein
MAHSLSAPVHSAVLLAAGRGNRQRPFTDTTPKPLLEVRGRATLDYVLAALARAGVERVCIVTNHLEDRIFEYVGDGARWKLEVTYAHQDGIHGSADALMSVPRAWIRSELILVTATDYILPEEYLLELVRAHQQSGADLTMSLKVCPPEELSARSSVQVEPDFRVRRIVEKPKPEEIMSPYAASILFILPPEIWSYLPKIRPSVRGEIELQSALDLMIKDGFKAYGCLQNTPEEWAPNV